MSTHDRIVSADMEAKTSPPWQYPTGGGYGKVTLGAAAGSTVAIPCGPIHSASIPIENGKSLIYRILNMTVEIDIKDIPSFAGKHVVAEAVAFGETAGLRGALAPGKQSYNLDQTSPGVMLAQPSKILFERWETFANAGRELSASVQFVRAQTYSETTDIYYSISVVAALAKPR